MKKFMTVVLVIIISLSAVTCCVLGFAYLASTGIFDGITGDITNDGDNTTIETGDETTNTGDETTQTPAPKHKVTFKAEGNVVGEVQFTEGDDAVQAPAVPVKPGYTGVWAEYVLGTGDIVVEAVYTIIEYTATFKADGEVVKEVKFTVNTESIEEPEVPAKKGHTGEWAAYELGTENIVIEAVYTAIKHKVTFKADGNVVGEVVFAEGDTSVKEPEVPAKLGYDGKWATYELGTEDITVEAIYTLAEYTAKFVADGVTIKEVKFTMNTESIDSEIPAFPEKEGYIGEWAKFELGTEDIVIEALYTAILKVRFMANGTEVFVAEYIDGDTALSVALPEVPLKPGYEGKWEEFELSNVDIIVNAIYTPKNTTPKDEFEEEGTTRTIKFIADIGNGAFIVDEIEFEIGAKLDSIEIPDVPVKEGYKGTWEGFELGTENITVNAIYELDSTTPFI